MSDLSHDKQDDSDEQDLPPSKSAIKREAEYLKELGTRLLKLNVQQLESIPMSDALSAAINEGKRMKSHEALRRHKQYIGKVLRAENLDAIVTFMNDIENAHTLHTRSFHQLETLRDKLISGDNLVIGEVIAEFQNIDTQKLRQLVRNAKKEYDTNQLPTTNKPETTHSRKLFRFLRDVREQHL